MPEGLDATFRQFEAFMEAYSWAKEMNNFEAFGFDKSKYYTNAVGLTHLRTVNKQKAFRFVAMMGGIALGGGSLDGERISCAFKLMMTSLPRE
jgi:hypothetical protein